MYSLGINGERNQGEGNRLTDVHRLTRFTWKTAGKLCVCVRACVHVFLLNVNVCVYGIGAEIWSFSNILSL